MLFASVCLFWNGRALYTALDKLIVLVSEAYFDGQLVMKGELQGVA